MSGTFANTQWILSLTLQPPDNWVALSNILRGTWVADLAILLLYGSITLFLGAWARETSYIKHSSLVAVTGSVQVSSVLEKVFSILYLQYYQGVKLI